MLVLSTITMNEYLRKFFRGLVLEPPLKDLKIAYACPLNEANLMALMELPFCKFTLRVLLV